MVTRRVGLSAEPGDELGAAAPRLPQMPAYHLVRADGSGITMVNIGVGPANAKTITDHIAVLRPHAWIMLGHCAGLRNSQQLGDYVLAHGYVRAKTMCWTKNCRCGCPSRAGRNPVALNQAVAGVTADGGADLKRIMRTGTVASTDNRNWELRARQPAPAPLQPEPRRGAGHGKRHHRRQRFPLPRALRHPAVRSDKPLHGEIKLPGMANHFTASGGPAPAHRHPRAGNAARRRHGPPARPQSCAALRRSPSGKRCTVSNGCALPLPPAPAAPGVAPLSGPAKRYLFNSCQRINKR